MLIFILLKINVLFSTWTVLPIEQYRYTIPQLTELLFGCFNGLCFRNYVVQYILALKIPFATANFISQFEGNYVHLSTQKFSSNVVEKCLEVFGEEPRSRIIHELLSSSRFEQLLQDPFANYVIQCALSVSKVSSSICLTILLTLFNKDKCNFWWSINVQHNKLSFLVHLFIVHC